MQTDLLFICADVKDYGRDINISSGYRGNLAGIQKKRTHALLKVGRREEIVSDREN